MLNIRLAFFLFSPCLGSHMMLRRSPIIMHELLLADDVLRPTERSDHLGKADGARE
jgi:hypothetical protein